MSTPEEIKWARENSAKELDRKLSLQGKGLAYNPKDPTKERAPHVPDPSKEAKKRRKEAEKEK